MALANGHGPIPILVVSGFLGSGKTTLLRNLLLDPEAGEIAVIVNEFGEVGSITTWCGKRMYGPRCCATAASVARCATTCPRRCAIC
jgi:predicted ATPase